ncbi:hypothetical protein ONZ45_g355 [Pleurotus djamor]|nr:hypothetical protein ONZ45_g355 [Pleurotus djamor]
MFTDPRSDTVVVRFFAAFPLYTHPAVASPNSKPLSQPTLWILPPDAEPESDVLSGDVDCLKWQAYLALRGAKGLAVRWDVASEGALEGKLPNLHVMPEESLASPENSGLLPASMIPTWTNNTLDSTSDPLDGYKNQASKDEGLAWTSLLETHVRAQVVLARPPVPYLSTLLTVGEKDSNALESIMNPPLPPLTGFSSLIRPMGTRINASAIHARYCEAIASLAERLGTDKWFLGSDSPTALDALLFAYIHTILATTDKTRVEVTRRVNLVAWEYRVRSVVRAAFQKQS